MAKKNSGGKQASRGRMKKPTFTHRQEPTRRSFGTTDPNADSYLIVMEGTKTEPNYFAQLAEHVIEAAGGQLHVETVGTGRNHQALVAEAKRIDGEDALNYQHVWLVFDCDGKPGDFDAAIREAKDAGYEVAWSNQCFEYWVCLHFNRFDTALSRSDWLAKAEELFKTHKMPGDGYAKNREDLYDVLQKAPAKPDQAKKWARSIRSHYPRGTKCSAMDPCTRVDMLVRELESYLKK